MVNKLLFVNWVLVVLLASCAKPEPNLSTTPVIAYQSITKYPLASSANQSKRDSVIIRVGFSDGDGDLGETVGDSLRQRQVFASQGWGNYQLRAFKWVNGQFVDVPIAPTTKLFFPPSSPQGGASVGLLDFRQVLVYSAQSRLSPVKFQLRLRDRQLQESNVIETDTVGVPLP